MNQRRYRVLIIGGGIAGLTTGIALYRAGHEVRIFERRARIEPLGAGLILWSNAVNALRAIELEDAVLSIGQPLARMAIIDPSGSPLTGTDARLISQKAGSTTVAVHRADLISILLANLPDDAVVTDKQFDQFETGHGSVTALFADGSAETGDILVGADGLHSRVRAQVHGDHHPRYSGYTAWRAISPNTGNPLFGDDISTETWGHGLRFGWVPLSRNRVYWFATKNARAGQQPDAEGHKAELLRHFGDWHTPIRTTIEATTEEAILRHDIYDRPPITNWGIGSVTLAGDAAHPMTPNTGQGAAQSIEDAVVLASCLTTYRTIAGALRAYERIRAPRTSTITDLSRRIGIAAQIEKPTLVRLRDSIARLTPDGQSARQLERIVGWQPPQSRIDPA